MGPQPVPKAQFPWQPPKKFGSKYRLEWEAKKKVKCQKKKKQQTGDLSSGSSKVLSWPMPSACFEGWSSSNGYNHACYIITSET